MRLIVWMYGNRGIDFSHLIKVDFFKLIFLCVDKVNILYYIEYKINEIEINKLIQN